ncbi:hypothetical protein L7F22_032797 [Adiantum nelumboides]|nr:hypothetical protein [Adiantum nelumboides]
MVRKRDCARSQGSQTCSSCSLASRDYYKLMVPSQLIAERGSDVVVISPGSRNLRVGLASSQSPLVLPHFIAWKINTEHQEETTGSNLKGAIGEDKFGKGSTNAARQGEREDCLQQVFPSVHCSSLSTVFTWTLRVRLSGSVAAFAPVLGTTQDALRPVTWTYELMEEDEAEMQTAIEHFSGRTPLSDSVSTNVLLARSSISFGSRLLVFQRWTPQFDQDEFDRQQQIPRFQLDTLETFSGDSTDKQFVWTDVKVGEGDGTVSTRKYICGAEALKIPSTKPYRLRRPICRGRFNVSEHYSFQQVCDDICTIWDWALTKELGLHKKQREQLSAVLVVPDTLDSREIKELLTIVLRDLQFSCAVIHQDSEELVEQLEDAMGRLVWLTDESSWYPPFTFLLRPDWPHPLSVVMWSIRDASEIFGVQEVSLRISTGCDM